MKNRQKSKKIYKSYVLKIEFDIITNTLQKYYRNVSNSIDFF